MEEAKGDRFEVTRFESIDAVTCPCGSTRRAFVNDPDSPASMHLVSTTGKGKLHYHKILIETYYFLEGEGYVELDGERHFVSPGSVVRIEPLCRHRTVGTFKFLNVVVPVFDEEDEWFD